MSSRALRNYKHKDFSYLLCERKGKEDAGQAFEEEPKIKAESAKAAAVKLKSQNFSLYRQRIFSDEKVKYIYSRKIKVLHEKHCACVKAIRDKDLQYSETYLPGMAQCSVCELDAYLGIGAKDPENTELYRQFFEQCGATSKQLRSMYVHKNMKTRVSAGRLSIWYKEDAWKIQLLPGNRRVQLLHNNYRVLKEGGRCFTQGFHVQNPICEDTNFGYALGLIRNYDYSPENALQHKKAKPSQMSEPSVVLDGREQTASSAERRWRKVRGWLQWLGSAIRIHLKSS